MGKISNKILVDTINAYHNLGDNSSDSVVLELLNELYQYRKEEEQGTLIRLPVKIGSEVWAIIHRTDDFSGYPYPAKTITNFRLDMLDKIGKTIFLTKEEAAEAVAKMK